ncbi:cell division protein SepF [Clostridium sp. DL1XJH146]
MAKKIGNKMMNFLGFTDDFDEIEEAKDLEDFEKDYNEENNDIDNVFKYASKSKGNNKVVSIHSAQSTKILIIKPSHYNDAVEICDNLKNRKICVINMKSIESGIAQRLIDFIAGSCYALGGSLEEVEKGVYVMSPSNIEVDNEFKADIKTNGMLNWKKYD